MNIKQLERIISDESIIKLKNGIEIKGSEQIALEIMQCCKKHSENIIPAAIIGSTIGAGIVIAMAYKDIKKNMEVIKIRKDIETIEDLIDKMDKYLKEEK